MLLDEETYSREKAYLAALVGWVALMLFTWSGYVTVNILIFVIAFLADAIISWLIYRYAKTQIQQKERES